MSDTLGKRDVTLLQAPPEKDLRLRLVVLLRKLYHGLLAPAFTPNNGAVRLNSHIALLTPLGNVIAGKPRVDLPLADAQDTTLALSTALLLELGDVLLQFIKVVNAVIAHTNGLDLALLDSLDESLPRALATLGSAIGSVQEHQIDVLEASLLEGALHLGLGIIVVEAAAGDLGREEDLGAGDGLVDLADGGAAAGLVLVDGGGINLVERDRVSRKPGRLGSAGWPG